MFTQNKSKGTFFDSNIKQLDFLLNEQRAQRQDLAFIKRQLEMIHNDIRLENQAEQYYQSKLTSPQTDPVKHGYNPDEL